MASMPQWPEPVIPVQTISETCIEKIPDRYIKPPNERPLDTKQAENGKDREILARIPVIDLAGLSSSHSGTYQATIKAISTACHEWGFFQVVNHGVSTDIIKKVKDVWRGFFGLSMEKKQVYANSPLNYDGYGSRVGVEKSAILDWGDYFFLSLLPTHSTICDDKWPEEPVSCRYI
jgi:non-haem dioxygenase in morphine synthesis N-terminal